MDMTSVATRISDRIPTLQANHNRQGLDNKLTRVNVLDRYLGHQASTTFTVARTYAHPNRFDVYRRSQCTLESM
jgi:hypothetical protein